MWGRVARFNIWGLDSGKSNIVYCEERYKGRQARTAMVFEGSTERVLVQPRRRSLVGDKEEPLWPRRDRQAS